MKQFIIFATLLTTPILLFSQSLFEKYQDRDNVASIVVNQKMFNMLAQMDIKTDDPEANEFIEQVNSLDNLTILTTEDNDIANSIEADVSKYVNSSKLEELMRIKDGDQNIKFYVREGKDENHVKELLMFVDGLKEITKNENITINGKQRSIEVVLLSLTGDIDLRKISQLTEQLQVPGADQLKKASKEKE